MSQSSAPPGEVGPWSATEVTALRFRNSEHAAILQVPSEILVSIFCRVIKTNPGGYEEAVRLVSSICHHLRTLVFGTPELWGFVNMRGSLGPVFLHRCQGNPISVVPFFHETDPEGRERIFLCLDYWRRMPNLHLTRVELIEFCGTPQEFMPLSWIFGGHYMPKLESLTLALGTLATGIIPLEGGVSTWTVSPNVQRTLKDVHLQQFHVPWSSNIFYGLSTLTLDYRGFLPSDASIPMDAFLEVLSHSPRLEKCSLYFALPQCHNRELFEDFNPARTINFPLLEELTLYDTTLNVAYLLRHIQYPPTAKVLLKVATPPNELEGLLSILFPPNTPLVDTPSKVALHGTSALEFRPALEIGCTTIQYLDGWDGILDPNDITHTTFTLPLVEAIHRAGPTIRCLRIVINCELSVQPEVWKEILEHLPNLEELIYMPGDDAYHDWPRFWEALCQTGGNGLVCQSLRTLRVLNLQGVTPDAVACVVMRWKLERPLDVFRFRVANCERSSTPEIIARLRPFVGQLIFEVIEGRNVVRLT